MPSGIYRRTEEHNRKVSEAKKGSIPWNKGRTGIYSKETLNSISKTLKGVFVGEKNPNYNPNLTDKDRIKRRYVSGYKEWRTSVYERDNFICQKCNISKSGKLNAHHIESYNNNPELRIEVFNGITLCEDCHNDFHHQCGRGDNTRKQLKEFLNKEK